MCDHFSVRILLSLLVFLFTLGELEARETLSEEWSLVKRKPFVCGINGKVYIYNNKLSPLSMHNKPLIDAAAKEFAKPLIDSCPEMETLTVFASAGPMSIGNVQLRRSDGWLTPTERMKSNLNPYNNRYDKSGISTFYQEDKAYDAEKRRRIHKQHSHRYSSKKDKNFSESSLCYEISGIAKVNINKAYYTDGGEVYLKPPAENFTKTPYLNSVPCSKQSKYYLSGHKLLMTNRFFTSFIGRMAGKPVYTDYEITTKGDLCAELPRLNFFTHRFESNHDTNIEHPILKNFFIYESGYWERYASRLYSIRKKQCSNLKKEEMYPLIIRVHIYDDGENVGWSRDKYTKYNQDNEGPFKLLYSGAFITGNQTIVKWHDDDPNDRYEYNAREATFQAKLAEIGKLRKARKQAFWSASTRVAAAIVGYVQGVTFEMFDEGICTFLTVEKDLSVNEQQYRTCHNTLFQMYEGLQAAAPETFFVGNLLGMMNTSFDKFLGDSKTREGEITRKALAEFLECMTTEKFSRSLDNPATPEELLKICEKWAAFGAVKGALTSPQKRHN